MTSSSPDFLGNEYVKGGKNCVQERKQLQPENKFFLFFILEKLILMLPLEQYRNGRDHQPSVEKKKKSFQSQYLGPYHHSSAAKLIALLKENVVNFKQAGDCRVRRLRRAEQMLLSAKTFATVMGHYHVICVMH